MKEIIYRNPDKKDYSSNEAYKILRTNVEFSGVDNKTIVVTSCMPGEGKSTTSISLAVSLAEAGKKVLLIDADMRKSVLHRQFQIQGAYKGLSHFLSGQAEVSDIMCKVQGLDLVVMLAGVVPPNPAEMLGQKRFKSLLTSGRKVYDYIIIDAPPLGSVIDAAIIAKQCDASILVMAAKTISRKFAKTVKSQLEKSGCPILGVVLNKVDMKENKYYGKYYGNYYGKH